MSHWSNRLRDAVDFGTEREPEHNHPPTSEWFGAPDCPACYVATIRAALAEYYSEPEPDIIDLPSPCVHDDTIGRVEADSRKHSGGKYISITTCGACLIASQGFVQAVTNAPASELIPFERKAAVE